MLLLDPLVYGLLSDIANTPLQLPISSPVKKNLKASITQEKKL